MTGPLISHLVAACVAAAIYGSWVEARFEAQIATIQTRHDTEKRVAAEDASQRLQAAQARGDRLSNSLLITEHLNDQLRTEVHSALNKKTTGRVCLGEPALRVLNTAPGITVSGIRDLPPATSGAVAESGVTATDSDVAHWAADAGAAYSTCSARLDALIDWHLAPPITQAAQGKAP